ncbi:MAG TPA: flagellar filament capping protein FliD [Tepidisphaeraceae bacterium]|jgi:flagellar hook-associated protein 2|nr:flagellar filament capping protein FliD [Tepidisphaeraceae bacterium]
MAAITSSVGLISGINTGAIIAAEISEDSGPVDLLQAQVTSAQEQEQVYQTLETQLNNMQQIGQNLALPETFQNATTTSSNPNVLTATAGVGAAVGSYQFQVAQLVTTQQSISGGFSDTTSSLVGAGTITLEEGGGEAYSQTPLSQLNGGAGVPAGQFRITDASGNSAVINTSNDVNLDDVVSQINNADGIAVHASVTDQGLVITDQSGGAGTLSIQDINGGTTAQSLGIVGTGTGGTLIGSNINYITAGTTLAQLNDGNGVATTIAGQNDFTVTVGDGSQIGVSLNGAKTVGDVINDINTVGGSKLKASINAAGNGITLTDTSGGGGGMTLTADNGSEAAKDLGLTGAASGNTIGGVPLLAGLDSVLIKSFNGGSGIPLGTISITDRAGDSGQINLSGAVSLSDIIGDINNNTAGVKVTAALNSSGTGIQITDSSGGAGNLVIGDVNSTTAAALGIAGTFDTTTQAVEGVNLQRQYVSPNTLLSNYNGGAGVALGQFQIQNSAGKITTVDLTQGTYNTIGDVMNAINATNAGVTASIDATGNGILLTDTAGGAGTMSVKDLDGGTTAANLNIAGAATGTTLDGAMEKTITVTSTDTLSSLQGKINQLGFGVTANIINDGSSTSPYLLSLTAVNSGQAGRVVINSGTTNLNIKNLVSAQDAAVFYGGSADAQPLLITSNTNQLTNVIRGVTVSLVSASSSPVSLSVSPDPSNVTAQLQNFVADFNSLVGTITTDSQYNTANNTGGILLGDSTAQRVQEAVYNMINSVVQGAGQYKDLADIGITVDANGDANSTTGTTLEFDASTFETAFANDPTAVQNLFSDATIGLGNVVNNAMDALTDPVNGIMTLQTNTLNTQISQYQDQINELNAILAEKKQQLQNEFNDMEETLATLQSQGSLLNAFSSAAASVTGSTAGLGSEGSSGSSSPSSSSSSGS